METNKPKDPEVELIQQTITKELIQTAVSKFSSCFIALCKIEPDALRELAQTKVNHLKVWQCWLTVELLNELAALQNLTDLDLSDGFIGPKGAECVYLLPNLQTLNLWSNQIGNQGLGHINKLKQLRILDIGNNKISSEGLSKVVQLPKLTTLKTNHNTFGDQGASMLSKLPHIENLEIAACNLSADCIESLLKLVHLQSLVINVNQIGNRLAKLFLLKRLKKISFDFTGISEYGKKFITKTIESRFALNLV